MALTAWQCQRNTSCLQFNLAAGCRRQITSAQSMLGDKSSEKCAGAPVAPVASVMRHQLVLLLRMVLPQTSHLTGKRRHDVEGTEGERDVFPVIQSLNRIGCTHEKMGCLFFFQPAERIQIICLKKKKKSYHIYI